MIFKQIIINLISDDFSTKDFFPTVSLLNLFSRYHEHAFHQLLYQRYELQTVDVFHTSKAFLKLLNGYTLLMAIFT